jgi:uncharacterized repeat protein (TIGR01451 family)
VATASANNTTYTYFSGAADVTSQVAKKGNGTYTFSGLKVSVGDPWCSVQGVVGGFSLAVIYSHPDEPFRMLNLYEGFKDFRDTSLSISLSGFNVPNPLPSSTTGRVGHITWEGDVTLSQGGEDLLFNGYAMTDTMNKQGNQFNSQSNVTGDYYSYGIDFDIYTLKSPVIQAGQTTATTTYKSGQDLVLLSAEIVAMPYSGIADLALSMTRTGDLTVGSSTDYTLTVTNGGIDAEVGPVTVVDTLPAGLKLISASGTKWTCTSAAGSNSTTVVTCTQAGPIAAGAKMTPITISATPTGLGNYTNTATVTGKTGDNNLANNKASNTGGAVDNGSAAMVFTREPCTAGQTIVVSDQDAGCHKFIGPVTAAKNETIYVTAVEGAQKAAIVATKSSTLQIDFKTSCLPYSNVSAAYAGYTLDCKDTWVTVPVTFAANTPSAPLTFNYADVGRVSLSMRFMGAVMATVNFISRPSDIQFRDVLRASDKVSDYEGAVQDQYAFAKAGEPFVMRLGAMMADGKWAPSFGRESKDLKDVMTDDQIDLDFQLDLFAVNLKSSPRVPIADKDDVVQSAFVVDQGFTLNDKIAGAMDATVRWYEAGVFAATPSLTDYLGSGKVGGPPAQEVIDTDASKRLVSGTRVIGRFYPDHFETTAVAPMACPKALNCPTVTTDPATTSPYPVSGAVYAKQPFSFSVEAFGLPRDGLPTTLSLYQNVSAREVTVTAVARPDGEKDPNGKFVPPTEKDKKLPVDPDPGVYPDLNGIASHTLGTPYSAATQASRSATASWIGPTLIYLRAKQPDTYITGYTSAGPITAAMEINSRVPTNAAAGTRYEDGLMVLSGRLFVPNVFGSDLLRLPVQLAAQYWNGTAWASSEGDNASIVATALVPNTCMRFFAADGKSGACKANPLTPLGNLPLQLADGKVKLMIQPPARGTVGSVDFSVDNGNAKVWLPSTIGRATFGLYRSPLIYLREVY